MCFRPVENTGQVSQISDMSSPFLEAHPREVVVETSPHPVSNNEVANVRQQAVGRKIQRVNPCQKNMCNAMNCQQKMEELDADRSFLLSLLMDYNRLTIEQKIDFRLCALQFLKNVVHPKTAKTTKASGSGPRYTSSQPSASVLPNYETKQEVPPQQAAVTSQLSAVDCAFPPAIIPVQIPEPED